MARVFDTVPFILQFLFEEEKVPLLTSTSNLFHPWHAELLSIRADYYTLIDYLSDRYHWAEEDRALDQFLHQLYSPTSVSS